MAMKIISPLEFATWLKSAAHGDRIAYYLGFLCHDRSYERDLGDQKVLVVNKELDLIARAVWEAYENRQVVPVQTKITNGVYSYEAVRL